MLLLSVFGGVRVFAQHGPDLTATNISLFWSSGVATYNLGPTGLRGWIYNYSYPNYTNGTEGTTTSFQPWQILVTAVGTNTPAYGIIQTNDVILGVSTGAGNVPGLFTNDARKSLGRAVTAAEAGSGVMNLLCWRAGVTNTYSIQLGFSNLSYSATAPYYCPKSAVVLSNAYNLILKDKLGQAGTPGDMVLALALLASGNSSYLPEIQAYARSIAPANLNIAYTYVQPDGGGSGSNLSGCNSWAWGYMNLFLSEYYLRTGDAAVLNAIKQYTLGLAEYQSRYGTFGHGGALLNTDGSLHGTIPPYGPVNQVGLVADMAIVMGNKCLVASGSTISPEIPAAIGRAANFFSYFVEKGNVPYGEHEPWPYHAGNGKEASAAVMFSLMEDQPAATEYFSRLAVAGYNGLQYGHSGQGLSFLWSALGANVGGSNAAAAYFSQIEWYLDLERRSDGSFVYDGQEQFGGSVSSTYWGSATYYGIDPTASWALTYAIANQNLYITGTNANPTNLLTTTEITNAIWAGQYDVNDATYGTNEWLADFSQYDPMVRGWAATRLGQAASATNLFPTLTNMVVANTNPWVREAACNALGSMMNTSALPVLVSALRDPDVWVRSRAAGALINFGSAASTAVTNMLIAYTNNATDPNVIVWTDPVQIGNGWLANALFNSSLTNSTIKVTNSLLYPAIQVGLQQPDSGGREELGNGIAGQQNFLWLLTITQVQAQAQTIMQAAATEGLANTMFSMYPRSEAIQALAGYHAAEALPVALGMQTVPTGFGWNDDIFLIAGLRAMTNYGDSARWTLPTLRSNLYIWDPTQDQYAMLNTAIATISAATSSPASITNLFPVANPQVVNTTNGKSITLTGFSCRTNQVGFTNVTAAAHGTVTGTPPNVVYTPTLNYTGMDSFTFQVFDSMTSSAPATVSLIVGMPAGTGLTGSYYTNVNFNGLKFTRTDTNVNFTWGTGAPTNTMASTNYSVRWTGQLLVPETGTYMFSTLNSDGVNLYVNGVQVVSDWNDQALVWTDGASLNLTAGQKYPVEMDYFEQTGNAVAKLKWTGPSFAGVNGAIIAPQWLYSSAGGTNWPAVAYPQAVTMLQNTNLAVTLVGMGSNVTFTVSTAPTNGTLSGTPPYLTYTPAAGYSGPDAFNFYVSNGLSNSAPATVSISVLAGLPVSFYWTNKVSGNWSVAANWTNSSGGVTAPAAAGQPFYVLNFNQPGSYTAANDLADGFLANQVNVTAAMTLGGGNSLTFTNNGPVLPQFIDNGSTNLVTVNLPVNLAATTTFGGTGGGNVTVNGVISGPGGLIQNNTGTLTLCTNTYTGGTIVNNGLVESGGAQMNSFLGAPGYINVTVGSGAEIQFGRNTIAGTLNLNGGTIETGNSYLTTWGGTVNLGLGTISALSVGGSGNFTVPANVTGPGGWMKLGTNCGVQTLTGTNNYTGPTLIFEGCWEFTTPFTLYSNTPAQWVPSNIIVSNLATMAVLVGGSGFSTAQVGVLLTNLTAVTNNGQANGFLSGAQFGFDTGNGSFTYAAPITDSTGTNGGPLGIVKYGNNTLTLSGTNTYSGPTIIAAGTLAVNSFNSVFGGVAGGSMGAPITVANGTIDLGYPASYNNNVVLSYVSTNAAGETSDRVLNMNAPSAGYTVTIDHSGSGPLKFTSPMTINPTSSQNLTLQGSKSGNGELVGALPLVSGLLTKKGTNTWTLDGANISTGGTTVSGGVLNCTVAAAVSGGPLTINGGRLQLNYFGTAPVSALTLGSTAEPNGTYGSTNSVATYQSTNFIGTGTVTVGPLPPATGGLTNRPATGVSTWSATLNATLGCTGEVYTVAAYWSPLSGGTNAALWTNSAVVGTWTNQGSAAIAFAPAGLAPATTYYFTFSAYNSQYVLWATNIQSFTTFPVPPTPMLPASGVRLTNGVPAFGFTAAAGCMYRLDYKNTLTDAGWIDGPWTTNSTGSPQSMTLLDTNAISQVQRYYRLEVAYP